jgi:hypothetical protein
MSKNKYIKVGIVRNGEYGAFISTGETRNKNEKYNYNVELRVTDADGKQVALMKNPLISVQDPRENPNITPERAAKIPDWLLKELYVKISE